MRRILRTFAKGTAVLALVFVVACGSGEQKATTTSTQDAALDTKVEVKNPASQEAQTITRDKPPLEVAREQREAMAESIPFVTKDPERVVGKVSETQITLGQVDAYISPQLRALNTRYKGEIPEDILSRQRQAALDRLVKEELQIAEAKKRGLEVPKEEYETYFNNLMQKFPSKDAFLENLSRQGLDEEGYKERLRRALTTRKLMEAVSEDFYKDDDPAIKAYYEENKSQYDRPEMVRVNQILVKVAEAGDWDAAQAKADGLYKEVTGGKDFAEVAKTSSEGPTARIGGDLNYIVKGRLAKEVDEQIFALDAGQVTKPIKTTQGYEIYKVTDKKAGGIQPFDEVKNSIRKRLQNEKVRDWVNGLEKGASVEKNL